MTGEKPPKSKHPPFDDPESRSESELNYPYKSEEERLEAEELLGTYKLRHSRQHRERLDQRLAANQLEIPSHLPEWHKAWIRNRQKELKRKK